MTVSTNEWLAERTAKGGAVVEAFPGKEPGTYGAVVYGELDVEQGAAAIEAVMVKLMESVKSPEDFNRMQQAIVARLASAAAPEPELET